MDRPPLVHLMGAITPIPPNLSPGNLVLAKVLISGSGTSRRAHLRIAGAGEYTGRAGHLCGETLVNLGNHVLSVAES